MGCHHVQELQQARSQIAQHADKHCCCQWLHMLLVCERGARERMMQEQMPALLPHQPPRPPLSPQGEVMMAVRALAHTKEIADEVKHASIQRCTTTAGPMTAVPLSPILSMGCTSHDLAGCQAQRA